MEIDKTKLREVKKEIRKVFLENWDPIGISKIEDWPQDEYDRYIGPIFNLLHRGTSKEELAQKLFEIETKNIGMENLKAEDLYPAAELLLKIDVDVKVNEK
jgi:hypothetical protein